MLPDPAEAFIQPGQDQDGKTAEPVMTPMTLSQPLAPSPIRERSSTSSLCFPNRMNALKTR